MKNIFLQIPDKLHSDIPLVLATVVATRGSTPQKPGSSALFDSRGLLSGTVGGGIVEGKVQKIAERAILSSGSGLYYFDLGNDISNTEEAICGGEITILVDANLSNSLQVLDQLNQSLAMRIPGVLITMVTGSEEEDVTIKRYWMSATYTPVLPVEVLSRVEPEVKKLFSEKNPSGFSNIETGITGEAGSSVFFIQSFFPPDLLIIAGAGHIGRALAHLASLLDFEVTVIDDRPEFANRENIPEADHIIVSDIGKAMDEYTTGKSTYAVIVTRGHKDDASALKPCFGKELAYIGMIGSRNKIAAMRLKFVDNGWATPDQWEKIHAPVGLAINSQTVQEIAVSIAAELIMIRKGKS